MTTIFSFSPELFNFSDAITEAPEWLSSFQIPVDSWSSISLTSEVNHNYREAIQLQRISLLDFRCYLFCRQAAMLLFTSKPWEVRVCDII